MAEPNFSIPSSWIENTTQRGSEVIYTTVKYRPVDWPDIIVIFGGFILCWWVYLKKILPDEKYTPLQKKLFKWFVMVGYPLVVIIIYGIQILLFKARFGV